MKPRFVPVLVLLIVGLCAVEVMAGYSVPVFRYALERWKPSPYHLTVFHRGSVSAQNLRDLAARESIDPPMNLRLEVVDTSQSYRDSLKQLFATRPPDTKGPWCALTEPDADPNAPPLWSGPLDLTTIRAYLDSPMRREVQSLLIDGYSVVFLFLESGNDGDDELVDEMLKRELSRLTDILDLPPSTPDDLGLVYDFPVGIRFQVRRLSRDDPTEAPLIRMLLNVEDDLDQERGPIVFPVFGRGRVLTPLYQETLRAGHIEEIARFLCKTCECRVKDITPGTDLPMIDVWDSLLRARVVEAEFETLPEPHEPELAGAADPGLLSAILLVGVLVFMGVLRAVRRGKAK